MLDIVTEKYWIMLVNINFVKQTKCNKGKHTNVARRLAQFLANDLRSEQASGESGFSRTASNA